jgi:hypothetical protein
MTQSSVVGQAIADTQSSEGRAVVIQLVPPSVVVTNDSSGGCGGGIRAKAT